jgi:putative transposase
VVARKAAYLAVGIDSAGYKDVLGIWIDQAEGAKFWLKICNELANRGVEDVIFVCVDGLNGLPEAIESVWPQAIVQTCVVHLVRASTRYASWRTARCVTAALKEIYRAPNEDAALEALERFEERFGTTATPRSASCGATRGTGSCRCWTTHPRSDGCSTPPTWSSP